MYFHRTPSITVALVLALSLLCSHGDAQGGSGRTSPGFQGAYRLVGQYPHDENEGIYYADFQGLTHDRNNWFFTAGNKKHSHVAILYKVPVEIDLEDGVSDCMGDPATGCLRKTLSQFNNMPSACDHFGDIDYYEVDQDFGYIVLPLECGSSSLMGFVRSDDLSLVATLDVSSYQSTASWVAVNGDSIYSGVSEESHIHQYTLNWSRLDTGAAPTILNVRSIPMIHHASVYNHEEPFVVKTYQGGVFTPDGSIFYLSTGYHCWDDEGTTGCLDSNVRRVHVFLVGDDKWRKIRASSTTDMPFQYATGRSAQDILGFDPGKGYWHYKDLEPEGITYWDLNDGRAPHILGELHVSLLNNDLQDSGSCVDCDNLILLHYSNIRKPIFEVSDLSSYLTSVQENSVGLYQQGEIIELPSYWNTIETSFSIKSHNRPIKLVSDGGTVIIKAP